MVKGRRQVCGLCIGVVALIAAIVNICYAGSPATRPAILVEGDDWKAPRADIGKVLESAGDQLLRHFPDRELKPILVSRVDGVPITFYQKGPNAEHRVGLATGGLYWCQYTYQFAHELGHILCNYDRKGDAGRNHWFEEALCETASLYVLGRMKQAWEANPPYPNFKAFAPSFDQYLNEMMAKRERRLPADMTMAMWLKANMAALEKERAASERSKLVAAYLLGLFQDEPSGWEALNWYNGDAGDRDVEFPVFLARWRDRVPARHRAFVGGIMRLFGFEPGA